VNLSPEGYTPTEEVTLASVDMWATGLSNKMTFNFDKTQTKVISKGGEEVKLQLKPGEFSIR
jgi:hypothetical protein